MYYVDTYARYDITSRVETVDSFFIYFDKTIDYSYSYSFSDPMSPGQMSLYYINYTSPLKFPKNTPIYAKPNGFSNGGNRYYYSSTSPECNLEVVGYGGAFQYFCNSCSCLTEGDGNGSYYGRESHSETRSDSRISFQIAEIDEDDKINCSRSDSRRQTAR